MEERALLLLGILMVHSQHGYQINEFIEMNLRRVTDMKKPTAYATLDRLADAGYVDVHTEKAGKRPTRKIYSITPQGEKYFFELLRTNLAQADKMNFGSDIGMMFVDHLPYDEALTLLEKRKQQLSLEIELHEGAPEHGFGFGVNFAMEHHLVHLKADFEWLSSVIERLKNQLEKEPLN